VVGHEAISDDPDACESLLVAEDAAKDLVFPGPEDPAPVDDARHDMIVGFADTKES
jgi:hypothetical protein